ncbi:MAG TPA: flagellar biosynthesis anti-sigma factor FlgM [Gemmataceae bacterium]|nr:flagellar biosynthesis anti-sigma factor FlgM [Gemmataceae bacterium]
MRIDPFPSPNVAQADATKPAGTNRPAGAPAEGAAADTLTPSPELLGLLDQLRQLPDVRPEAVAEAARRLAAGDYSRPPAVSGTVESILGAGPG